MPGAKVKEHNELMWNVIDDAFGYSKGKSASIPQDRSLYDFVQTKVKEKNLDRASSEIVLQMARIWGDFIGVGYLFRATFTHFRVIQEP